MFLFDIASSAVQDQTPAELLAFLPVGYLVTVLIETPVLLLGMSRDVPLRQRFFCGLWLTACTYPIVVLVLPTLLFGWTRFSYLAVAEVFAPLAECIIFWLVFRNKGLSPSSMARCLAAIVAANLASFALGEVLNYNNWFNLL